MRYAWQHFVNLIKNSNSINNKKRKNIKNFQIINKKTLYLFLYYSSLFPLRSLTNYKLEHTKLVQFNILGFNFLFFFSFFLHFQFLFYCYVSNGDRNHVLQITLLFLHLISKEAHKYFDFEIVFALKADGLSTSNTQKLN